MARVFSWHALVFGFAFLRFGLAYLLLPGNISVGIMVVVRTGLTLLFLATYFCLIWFKVDVVHRIPPVISGYGRR